MRRISEVSGLAVVAVQAVLVTTPALAGNQFLEAARRARAELEYDKVTPLLERALKAAADAREEGEIYELLATMHVMYGRERAAEDAFVNLLRRKPDFVLPADTSPKIAAAFSAARKRAPAPDPVTRAETLPSLTVAPQVPLAAADRFDEAVTWRVAEATAPLYQKWWFWSGLGAVLAAGVGAGLWLYRNPHPPAADFGPYRMP